jgi:hypothetical protein
MKKTITLVVLFITAIGFSQQISDGSALLINDFTVPLKSGIYNGSNPIGATPDNSNPWQHLFVTRHYNLENNHELQISSAFTENDRLFFRKIANLSLSSKNPTWIELATRGNNSFEGNQFINGSVGIGNINPLAKLDISGNLILRNYENITGKGSNMMFTAYGDDLYGPKIRSYLTFASGVNSNMGLVLSSYCSGYKDELFLYNGMVGIGTMSPQNKLDVNGTIHSKEVKVDMNGWPDYVFKKEYNLPTLKEVEKQITEKGHLENIPSEEEVLKNGINLGEMNAKLLQKIEELTLYMINQNKNIEVLMQENQNQNQEIANLKEKLSVR